MKNETTYLSFKTTASIGIKILLKIELLKQRGSLRPMIGQLRLVYLYKDWKKEFKLTN